MQIVLLGAVIAGLISIARGLIACYYEFRDPPLGNDRALPAKQPWHGRSVANGKRLGGPQIYRELERKAQREVRKGILAVAKQLELGTHRIKREMTAG
jgi:hypothetical protein